MYYKVIPGSETHTKLLQMQLDIKAANKARNAFIDKTGAAHRFLVKYDTFSSISALIFDNPPDPKLWKKKKTKDISEDLWVPKLNTVLREEFDALPVVRYSRIAEICDYDMQEGPPSDKGHRRKCSLYPGYEPLGDTFIIKVYDWVEWRPKDSEMIEITNKEYLTIKAKASAKKKVKPQTVKAQ